MANLISIEEAQRLVLDRARPLDSERVPVESSRGRVVAEDARAEIDLPPFASSAMDGFAVRAGDLPARLPIVERIAAGRPASRALEPGEAMAISTGGAVPEGADVVVPIEDVVDRGDEVEIGDPVAAGANVRPRAGDVRSGVVVVPAGERLGPAQLGALAAAGVTVVACARRPRAAIVTTGSELRRPGDELGPGEIYEANGTILAAALEGAGAEVERLPAVEDEAAAHREALVRAMSGDILVTSGGVSVGPHDLVRQIEAELGVEEVFWGVAVKPGKPISFGVRGSTLVFGLPGNPVSALVGFELFVRPAVLALQGLRSPLPRFLPGRLGRDVRRNRSRDELVRARSLAEGDELVIEPLDGQDSHMIARAAGADVLVLVPRGDGELSAGTRVRYLPLV